MRMFLYHPVVIHVFQGSAFVRTKLKNLISGNTNDKTWRAGEAVIF
jgi:translation elongation factor P/translation initiation factor 5A